MIAANNETLPIEETPFWRAQARSIAIDLLLDSFEVAPSPGTVRDEAIRRAARLADPSLRIVVERMIGDLLDSMDRNRRHGSSRRLD